MTDVNALATRFRPLSRDDWQRLVKKSLKGASLDSVGSATREGIPIEPVYPPARDAQPLFARPREGGWLVVQRLDHTDPGEANAQACRELERGATGLALVPRGAPAADGFGLPLVEGALPKLLDGIDLKTLHLRVEPHADAPATSRALVDHYAAVGLEPADSDIAFGLDPIGIAASEGGLAREWPHLAAGHAELAKELASRGFRGPILEADCRVYAAAGADAVQELAAALSSAAAYLRLLDEWEASLALAFQLLGMTLTVDSDQLVSMAKLRAARLLWARMQEICGAPTSPLRLHAETARRMMMRADPHSNLLRTTVAAFAAGVGGADSLTVLPFTIALGLPDAFARRLARNTQLLMMEESHLHRVADPAAGSGAIEALTAELSRRAWDAFREIEREGGIVESLKAGRLQARIAAQRQALMDAHAQGKAGLVGVTHYVDTEAASVKLAELPPREAPPRRQPAVAFERLEPIDLEPHVSRVPENAP